MCTCGCENKHNIEPVKIQLLLEDFKELKKHLLNSMSPMIVYTGDLEEMQRAARIESEANIRAALKIVRKYDDEVSSIRLKPMGPKNSIIKDSLC